MHTVTMNQCPSHVGDDDDVQQQGEKLQARETAGEFVQFERKIQTAGNDR
jgi:hypothetical protein